MLKIYHKNAPLTKEQRGWKPPANLEGTDSICQQYTNNGTFVCTRSKGHKGNHVAHGMMDQIYAEWDDKQ